MMKYLSHCLAVSMFFLAFSLDGQNVEISIDHPDRVNAGEDFTVSVIISKGSFTDYSRFSQDLPLGLTAANVNSPNADFSFDDQRVRIIWLKMPESNDIKISYLVSVDSRLKGSFRLGGVFAYVVDDERKFLNFDDDRMITIVPNSSIDQALIVDIKDFEGGTAVVSTATQSKDAFAMAIRQKPVLQNNGGYLVHLLIDNPTGSKYAKVEETIPSGYLFEEVRASEGIVSHAASTVKFIWMKMPEQSEFEVVYRLVPKQNEPQGNMLIEGLLTYTSGNENKIADIVEMNAPLDKMTSAQKRNLLATGELTEVSKTVPPVKKPVQTEIKPATTSSNVGTASARVIVNTKVLDRGAGTYFRVQLIANRKPFDAQDFYRKAGLDKEVLVEQHEGLYKYTAGPFQSYNEAVSYRRRIDGLSEVEGAFVVGYQNGKRVPASSIK
jgi:hypothetical protein